MRRRSLGKGLSELMHGETLAQSRAVIDVPVNRLAPNPRQPRIDVDGDKLEELTLSVEAHGVLQPILVRLVDGDYEIIAGERRWRAAQRAGLEAVPCIVQDMSDEESLQVALIENLQRQDLNAVEAARGYRRLVDDFGLTQEQLATLIGKSRSAIANTLRLLDLPHPVQQAIQNGRISEGHGRALLGLGADDSRIVELWGTVEDRGLSVRDTEQLVREAVAPPDEPAIPTPATREHVDPNLQDVQERVQRALATKVMIRRNALGGGRFEIAYHDPGEFERLLDLLLSLG